MKQETLIIESFLVVLERLVRTGEVRAVLEGKKIRLERGKKKWTPLTLVVYELAGILVEPSEEARRTVDSEFLTTADQVSRIIDAEDGRNGYSGYDYVLRTRLEGLAALCAA